MGNTNSPVENDEFIDVICLSCFKNLKVPARYAGTTGHCKHCGAEITVPHLLDQQARPRSAPKAPIKGVERSSGYLQNIRDTIRERLEFFGGLFAATAMGLVWTLILATRSEERILFSITALLFLLLMATGLYLVFGGLKAAHTLARLGLNEDAQSHLPLNTLSIIFGVLCLTHFIPIAPFLFNLLGMYRQGFTTHNLALNFIVFGLYPLLTFAMIRRGNLWVLGATTVFFVGVFFFIYYSTAKYSGFSTFNVYYFMEIAGFATFLYWALSAIIYVLSMIAMFACWKKAAR